MSFTPSLFAQFTHPYENVGVESSYKKLQKNFSQLASNVTLRSAVDGLSKNSGVLIWLDRRVDGEKTVTIDVQNQTFIQALEQLADSQDLVIVWVGNIPALCRTEDAEQIEAIYWQTCVDIEKVRVKSHCDALEWGYGATVDSIIDMFSKSNSLEFSGNHNIEHDQWNAATIPAGSTAMTLTLLASGFERQPEFANESTFDFRPYTVGSPKVAFPYDAAFLKKIPENQRMQWLATWKAATQWRTVKDRQWLNAPVAAHRELYLASIVLPKTNSPPAERDWSKIRLTMKWSGRLKDNFPAMLAQLDLKLDSELSQELAERSVVIDVRDVTLDALLQEIANKADCVIVRNQQSVSVTAD